VLQRVAACCSVLQREFVDSHIYKVRSGGLSLVERDAAYCSVLQCFAACRSVLQRVAVCCSVLQCVAA